MRLGAQIANVIRINQDLSPSLRLELPIPKVENDPEKNLAREKEFYKIYGEHESQKPIAIATVLGDVFLFKMKHEWTQ